MVKRRLILLVIKKEKVIFDLFVDTELTCHRISEYKGAIELLF